MSDRRERVAEALAAHQPGGYNRLASMYRCTCGALYVAGTLPDHQAAVLDALGDDTAQAKVERVETLARRWNLPVETHGEYDGGRWHRAAATQLRAALDPETGP